MSRSSLFAATTNAGKVAEFQTTWREFFPDAEVIAPDRSVAYPEEGADYRDNAMAKALAAARFLNAPCLADDSGLEVDALGGRPGAFSARYGSDDAARIARLLDELKGVPAQDRTARFRCIAALAFPDGRVIDAEGVWEGLILDEPAGEAGFGYDPVFFDPLRKRTAAEMSKREKSSISHRGTAVRNLALKVQG